MANLWHDRLYAVRGLLRVLAEIQGELDRWLPFPRHGHRLEPLVVRLGKKLFGSDVGHLAETNELLRERSGARSSITHAFIPIFLRNAESLRMRSSSQSSWR